MGYYFVNAETEDMSSLFPTLKGCIAAAEGVAERDKTNYQVFAQTSAPDDLLVGTVSEYDGDFTIWCFDYSDDWPFKEA